MQSVPHAKDSWHIAVQHQAGQSDSNRIQGRCLSTSGDYATKFSADYRHHHLLDPGPVFLPQLSAVSIAALLPSKPMPSPPAVCSRP